MTTPLPSHPRHRVFTVRSLQACLEAAQHEGWPPMLEVPADGGSGVVATTSSEAVFVIHRGDTLDVARIVVLSQGAEFLGPVPPSSYANALERIHRVALEAEHFPVTLPSGWSEFRSDNKIAFFATPRTDGSLRWISELRPLGSLDTVFWRITTGDDQVALEAYEPPYDVYSMIVSGWSDAFASAQSSLGTAAIEPVSEPVQPTVDLAATTFGAVTQYQTYSTWLDRLTPAQREFLESPPDRSVKLRGPAGSGKTLVLELKALRELYESHDRGEPIRILFATHSWAMAEQVDSALRQMDERGDISEIEVYPLVSIAQSILPSERTGAGFSLLGEDSLTGKRLQIEELDKILDSIAASDWLFYADGASPLMRSRMTAPRGSQARNSLVWDLLMEFASVLSAHGILPGINAERQYLSLPRTRWMMPLDSETDKLVVLLVYTKYVTALSDAGVLTTDQLTNDFLNYLATFAWNIRRQSAGYDLILVDELHLFTDQERLVLHYLTRSPDVYPRMFMALDPRQSPAEMYVDVGSDAVMRGGSGLPDEYLGDVQSMELATVHRFTPEILDVVRHINQSYPALDLGEDWSLDLSSVESSVPTGSRPTLVTHASSIEEAEAVARSLAALQAQAGSDRVALVVLEATSLPTYVEVAERHTSVAVISGRDDVEKLQYTRRSAVVGAAEFLAGLQFSAVVVAGFPNTSDGYANLGHQLRRFLSLLYLSVSRATTTVEIHVNDESGGIPPILESAVAAGVLELGR